MKCKTDGCDGEVKNKTRQLCQRCYFRFRKYEDPNAKKCKLDDCSNASWARGLCSRHYQVELGNTRGDGTWAQQAPKGPRKMEGRYTNSAGYVMIKVPGRKNGGWVLEHRVVMEKYLGRPLEKGENVHHKDGNIENNNIDNLELWIRNQPNGQRVEDMLAWAKEIIRRYDNEAVL